MAKTKLPKLHSDYSVDCVIFGFDEGELKVLLVERNEPPYEGWTAIPGNLGYDTEDLDEAELNAEMEGLIEAATAFYDREMERYEKE